MAKMSFVLIVLCGLASMAIAEQYGAMPYPATYEAPTPAPTPAPVKYEAPAPVKYEAPAPAKYEEKKETYPAKPEYKKMEEPPKKMVYGGKKYRRSVEVDPEQFEEETADPKRKYWSDEDIDELMDARKRKGYGYGYTEADELMDARKWKGYGYDEADELMDPRKWRGYGYGYTEADAMQMGMPMYPRRRRCCYWCRGRRHCKYV